MKKPTPEIIEHFYDGELSKNQATEVEQYLQNNPEAKLPLKNLEKVGDLLRLMHEEAQLDVSFEGFSERVSQGIQSSYRPKLSERASVWFSEFFEHRKVVWMPATALAAAAAIALTFTFALNDPPPIEGMSQSGAPIWVASRVGEAQYSKISSVDFGDAQGKIFEIETTEGGAAGVVWIVE